MPVAQGDAFGSVPGRREAAERHTPDNKLFSGCALGTTTLERKHQVYKTLSRYK